jgi:hypothetical protein
MRYAVPYEVLESYLNLNLQVPGLILAFKSVLISFNSAKSHVQACINRNNSGIRTSVKRDEMKRGREGRRIKWRGEEGLGPTEENIGFLTFRHFQRPCIAPQSVMNPEAGCGYDPCKKSCGRNSMNSAYIIKRLRTPCVTF